MNCNRGLLRGSRNKPHNCFYQSVRQSRTFSQLENASSVERPKLVSGLYWGSKNCTWERQFDRSTKRRTNWDRRPRAGMKFWKGSNAPTPPHQLGGLWSAVNPVNRVRTEPWPQTFLVTKRPWNVNFIAQICIQDWRLLVVVSQRLSSEGRGEGAQAPSASSASPATNAKSGVNSVLFWLTGQWPRKRQSQTSRKSASLVYTERVHSKLYEQHNAEVFVCVCVAHFWALSKRCKLESQNLHCWLPQGL